MTDKRYWIWLQKALGIGVRFKEIIDEFGSIEKLYASNLLEWRMSSSLTSKQIESLQKYSLKDADKIVEGCAKNGWKIITYDDELYPDRLKEISNPPAVLYVDGDLPDLNDAVVIGVVGTRKASSYALKAAYIMSKGISLCGGIIISGGALGVDSAAHKGALSANAKTIAVLGNGFGSDYLKSNLELRERISNTGALVTEFPPYTPASKTTFPMRNRIISGLSLGILVVEAGVKSGSLITARHAAEQGRDIFAIPASIFDYNFYGTNKLIDDGAIVATSPKIILETYSERYKSLDLTKLKTVRELYEETVDKSANVKKEKQVHFDDIAKDRAQAVKRQNTALELVGDEKIVFSSLGESFEVIDIITQKAGIEIRRVLVALTMLEMKGLAVSTSGKRYKLK